MGVFLQTLKTIGWMVAGSTTFAAVCFLGASVNPKMQKDRLPIAGCAAAFLFCVLTFLVVCDELTCRAYRRQVRELLKSRPLVSDEAFAAAFEAPEQVEALDVRRRLGGYFGVDPRHIAADEPLENLELNLLANHAGVRIGVAFDSQCEMYYETVRDYFGWIAVLRNGERTRDRGKSGG